MTEPVRGPAARPGRAVPQPSRRSVVALLGGVAGGLLGVAGVTACGGRDEVDEVLVEGGIPGQDWAALVSDAVAAVEDLWGPGAVARPVRLAQPGDDDAFRKRIGDPGAVDVPAVTLGSTTGSAAGAVVVLHPEAWTRLSREGRAAVLTHEITHLAMQGDGPVPTWLGEGLAELTAHRASTRTVSEIAGSALETVRDGRLPAGWPDPLREGGPRWPGYALAWLACHRLAQVHGERDLLALYDTVAAGRPLAAGFRDVLGVGEDDALADWRSWIDRLAQLVEVPSGDAAGDDGDDGADGAVDDWV